MLIFENMKNFVKIRVNLKNEKSQSHQIDILSLKSQKMLFCASVTVT